MEKNKRTIFSLKRIILTVFCILFFVVSAIWLFLWFLGAGVSSIQNSAQNDPVGEVFLSYFKGGIDYEQSSEEKLFLEYVAGSNALELTIDLSPQPPSYELTCSQVTTGVVYYNLKGTPDEVIEKIEARDCFDQGGNIYTLRPDIEEKY